MKKSASLQRIFLSRWHAWSVAPAGELRWRARSALGFTISAYGAALLSIFHPVRGLGQRRGDTPALAAVDGCPAAAADRRLA
jgi:hypothetical protein